MKTFLSGNAILVCKNPECEGRTDLGFVADLTSYAERFGIQEFTCPICKLKDLYPGSHLLLIPAKIPEEK